MLLQAVDAHAAALYSCTTHHVYTPCTTVQLSSSAALEEAVRQRRLEEEAAQAVEEVALEAEEGAGGLHLVTLNRGEN